MSEDYDNEGSDSPLSEYSDLSDLYEAAAPTTPSNAPTTTSVTAATAAPATLPVPPPTTPAAPAPARIPGLSLLTTPASPHLPPPSTSPPAPAFAPVPVANPSPLVSSPLPPPPTPTPPRPTPRLRLIHHPAPPHPPPAPTPPPSAFSFLPTGAPLPANWSEFRPAGPVIDYSGIPADVVADLPPPPQPQQIQAHYDYGRMLDRFRRRYRQIAVEETIRTRKSEKNHVNSTKDGSNRISKASKRRRSNFAGLSRQAMRKPHNKLLSSFHYMDITNKMDFEMENEDTELVRRRRAGDISQTLAGDVWIGGDFGGGMGGGMNGGRRDDDDEDDMVL